MGTWGRRSSCWRPPFLAEGQLVQRLNNQIPRKDDTSINRGKYCLVWARATLSQILFNRCSGNNNLPGVQHQLRHSETSGPNLQVYRTSNKSTGVEILQHILHDPYTYPIHAYLWLFIHINAYGFIDPVHTSPYESPEPCQVFLDCARRAEKDVGPAPSGCRFWRNQVCSLDFTNRSRCFIYVVIGGYMLYLHIFTLYVQALICIYCRYFQWVFD